MSLEGAEVRKALRSLPLVVPIRAIGLLFFLRLPLIFASRAILMRDDKG